VPHLLQFTAEHREEGFGLQNEVEAFEAELKECIEEIWSRPSELDDGNAPEGWAARMAEVERNKAVDPLDKVVKPELFQGKDWRIRSVWFHGA
jgi:elongator complex protein 1